MARSWTATNRCRYVEEVIPKGGMNNSGTYFRIDISPSVLVTVILVNEFGRRVCFDGRFLHLEVGMVGAPIAIPISLNLTSRLAFGVDDYSKLTDVTERSGLSLRVREAQKERNRRIKTNARPLLLPRELFRSPSLSLLIFPGASTNSTEMYFTLSLLRPLQGIASGEERH